MCFRWLSIIIKKGDIGELGGTAQPELQPLPPMVSLTSLVSETPTQLIRPQQPLESILT